MTKFESPNLVSYCLFPRPTAGGRELWS